MATSVIQAGGYASAEACVTAFEAATEGLTITNTFAQGVIKEGSSSWRYYFIYN